jgi:hypothetical protein
MLIVPMQPIPAQLIKTTLDNQTVELNIYTRRYGLFIDVTIIETLEIGAVICQNLNRIIRSAYLNVQAGFAGDFIFNDTQGSSDPVWTGLGARYQLLYLSQDELTSIGLAA